MNCKLISEVTNASTWTKTQRTAATFCSFYIIITTNKQKEAHFTSQRRFPRSFPTVVTQTLRWRWTVRFDSPSFTMSHDTRKSGSEPTTSAYLEPPTNNTVMSHVLRMKALIGIVCCLLQRPHVSNCSSNLTRINFINQKQRKNQ